MTFRTRRQSNILFSSFPSTSPILSVPDGKVSHRVNYQEYVIILASFVQCNLFYNRNSFRQPQALCRTDTESHPPVDDLEAMKQDTNTYVLLTLTLICILPKLMKNRYYRFSSQNAEVNALWEIYNNLSDRSFIKPDGQPDTCPVPFQPIMNTPSHRTTSRMPFSFDINADTPAFWPSPFPILSSLRIANQAITDEEYGAFLRACNYPGPIREYWENVAKQTNQLVFECTWEGCLMFVLHPPVPTGIPSEVVAHLSDHCWSSGRCLWRGCKERKEVQAENMCRHLMAHQPHL